MASIAENGLFPPIIDAYLPAIEAPDYRANGVTIPLNLNYNDPSDIKSVHVSFTRQSNYHSGFNKKTYIRGIYVQNVDFSAENVSITIPYSAFANGTSETDDPIKEVRVGEYYKVQVRVSSQTIPSEDLTGSNLSNYLTNTDNMAYFSEWSTVCLARFIATQKMTVIGNGQVFGRDNPDETIPAITLDNSTLQLVCAHRNNSTEDTEYLNSCQFNVYQMVSNQEELVFSSPAIYTVRENPNQINYTLPYFFNNGNYKLELNFITSNLYEGQRTYNFTVNYDAEAWSTQQVVQEAIAVDSVIGKVNISLMPFEDAQGQTATIPAHSKFIIRRGSDADNFTIWDTLYTKQLQSSITGSDKISYDDFTIESGVLYKYEITFISPTSISGHKRFSIVEPPVISVFDHAWLTGEGTQLCVKFNPQISSYKINVGDAIVTPIGSQYPYISRNGDMYYRTFSLSGTIAYEMDPQHHFASRASIYGDWIQVYGSYFVNRYINQQNDRVTQRKFRELVMAYLYNDMPKLFRSTPEGNILVRLTDVSLTPKTEVGRMIYDFSCTATEIGEASVENCKMYKIQDYGD